MDTYILIDGVECSQQYPDTFHVPSPDTKDHLVPGDFAKLGFEPKRADLPGERMWVRIIERDGDAFVGELDNTPVVLKQLKLGERIDFTARHILDVAPARSTDGA